LEAKESAMPPGTVTELISHLTTALANCSLYSEQHPLVAEFSTKALSVIEGLYVDETLSLTLLGDSLVFNNNPITDKGPHISSLKRRLKRKGIEKIVARKGLTAEELVKFIAGVTSSEKAVSSPHLSVGMVEVRFSSGGGDVSALMNENIAKVKGIYQGVAKFKRLDMVSLEDAVAGFITTLKRETNILRIVSPVKAYSEYTYIHASNVSVLTIFQAEALGMKGEDLHDVGLSGLLHDVGKLFVSKDVLEKNAKLDPEEWKVIKEHPVSGARYLAALADVPKIALIAAFEHHMKFNGSGYPDTKRRGKRQHIISQMVALADFFDALRAQRPYSVGLESPAVVQLMKEAAGKDFNPMLVENFLGTMKSTSAI
jgi:HD-GYP domain-containing protein (c-di-GMP phosphodiesterase class II)